MIRTLLLGTLVVGLSLTDCVARAGFVNRVTVTITTKKADLGDLVKEAERALDRARFAVIDAKADVARANRAGKTEPSKAFAIGEARLAHQKTKDAEALAQRRVDKLREARRQELSDLLNDKKKHRDEESKSRMVVHLPESVGKMLMLTARTIEAAEHARADGENAITWFADRFSGRIGDAMKCKAQEAVKALRSRAERAERAAKRYAEKEVMRHVRLTRVPDTILGEIRLEPAKIQILYGDGVCETVGILLPVTDIELSIPFKFDIDKNHLRESTSERGKVRVVKFYQYRCDEDGEPKPCPKNKAEGWEDVIWHLTMIEVTGKVSRRKSNAVTTVELWKGLSIKIKKSDEDEKIPTNVSAELLPSTLVPNADARFFFAGEEERHLGLHPGVATQSGSISYVEVAPQNSCSKVGPKKPTMFHAVRRIEYLFPFQNVVD